MADRGEDILSHEWTLESFEKSLICAAFAPIGVARKSCCARIIVSAFLARSSQVRSDFLSDLDAPFDLPSNFPFTLPVPFGVLPCLLLALPDRALPFPCCANV